MTRRVVITGLGLISPLGNTVDKFWNAIQAGESGVKRFQSIPADSLPTKVAGECREFTASIDDFGKLPADLKKTIRKGLRVMCRESQMGVAAAQLALDHAGLPQGESDDPERCGVVFGSDYMMTEPEELCDSVAACADAEGKFNPERWGTDGLSRIQPLWLLKYLPNMPASHIAIFNDLRGPNNSITLREAAANLAIGEAYHTIERDSADRVIAGATGTRVHQMKAVHAAQSEQLADNFEEPHRAARPFDRQREGMVLGEGSASIVLEELETALARGATILGEVVGAASSSVATRSMVARRDQALANAMRMALRDADMSPDDVGHINAHGLGTVTSDIEEYKALEMVFGDRAKKIPVVAAKSYFGNLGAGSGIVELIASVLAMQSGKLFPILNYEEVDPLCPILAAKADTSAGGSFLSLNVTPQGQAAVIAVKAWK